MNPKACLVNLVAQHHLFPSTQNMQAHRLTLGGQTASAAGPTHAGFPDHTEPA